MTGGRFKRAPRKFPHKNVLGLPGRVFGRHWHQKSGPKVRTDHGDWCYDVRIRWPSEEECNRMPYLRRDEPLVMAHGGHWPMFTTGLDTVEGVAAFPIREHCARLCREAAPRKPVILEWGCGAGFAVKDLTADPRIRGKGLVYGYGDIWDSRWNHIPGVKFLFFVKEHLLEYFKRSRQRIDFIFSHGGLENLHGEEFREHVSGLARIMNKGARIVFPSITGDRERFRLEEFVHPDEPDNKSPEESCVLIRK